MRRGPIGSRDGGASHRLAALIIWYGGPGSTEQTTTALPACLPPSARLGVTHGRLLCRTPVQPAATRSLCYPHVALRSRCAIPDGRNFPINTSPPRNNEAETSWVRSLGGRGLVVDKGRAKKRLQLFLTARNGCSLKRNVDSCDVRRVYHYTRCEEASGSVAARAQSAGEKAHENTTRRCKINIRVPGRTLQILLVTTS